MKTLTSEVGDTLVLASMLSSRLQDFLWKRAEAHLREMLCRGRDALLLWDESVWEKPESTAPEGLGSVRSAHAARLKRSKPGFSPPSSCPACSGSAGS
jgi:hypothetical protein